MPRGAGGVESQLLGDTNWQRMYSDDEDAFGVGGRSPSPGDGRSERRRDDDRGPKGGSKGGDKGRQDRRRTTGREIPKLYSIHKGTVARVQDYGAFVRLGDGSRYKDGLLHISRLSASGRVEAVADVLAQDDAVWVKVVEVREEEGKFSLDMRFVGQRDGEDQDPNNVQADAGKGKGQGKSAPEPIRIGAIQATTCSRCGARGHSARECWAGGGKQYDLVEEGPEASGKAGGRGLEDAAGGHDAATVKKALQEYFKRKAAGEDSSSSSSSSDKKKKKKKKKEKKKEKKEKKKRKKEKKKDRKSVV